MLGLRKVWRIQPCVSLEVEKTVLKIFFVFPLKKSIFWRKKCRLKLTFSYKNRYQLTKTKFEEEIIAVHAIFSTTFYIDFSLIVLHMLTHYPHVAHTFTIWYAFDAYGQCLGGYGLLNLV